MGFRPDAGEQIAAIDRKVENIRRAVEDGLNDANWANSRLRELHTEKEGLVTAPRKEASGPPQLDAATAMDYRRQADELFRGSQAERKQLLRTLIGGSKADAPGPGGEYQLPPAPGHYEWIGCGGLQRSERTQTAISIGIGRNHLNIRPLWKAATGYKPNMESSIIVLPSPVGKREFHLFHLIQTAVQEFGGC